MVVYDVSIIVSKNRNVSDGKLLPICNSDFKETIAHILLYQRLYHFLSILVYWYALDDFGVGVRNPLSPPMSWAPVAQNKLDPVQQNLEVYGIINLLKIIYQVS